MIVLKSLETRFKGVDRISCSQFHYSLLIEFGRTIDDTQRCSSVGTLPEGRDYEHNTSISSRNDGQLDAISAAAGLALTARGQANRGT